MRPVSVWSLAVAAVAVAAVVSVAPSAYAKKAKFGRISVDPYGMLLRAAPLTSGFSAEAVVPDGQDFAFGFTLPNDYKPGGMVTVELLVDSAETGVNFELRPNFLFPARAGMTRGGGNASDGLAAIDSTTAFTLAGDSITFDAPAAQRVEKVRFAVTAPAAFTALQPGDAINLGLYRNNDTATGGLGIAGVSVVYQQK